MEELAAKVARLWDLRVTAELEARNGIISDAEYSRRLGWLEDDLLEAWRAVKP